MGEKVVDDSSFAEIFYQGVPVVEVQRIDLADGKIQEFVSFPKHVLCFHSKVIGAILGCGDWSGMTGKDSREGKDFVQIQTDESDVFHLFLSMMVDSHHVESRAKVRRIMGMLLS